jgi:serine/threonine-protein kinase
MSQEEDLNESGTEEQRERRWRAWLPWIVLLIVLLIVAWLIWTYSDFGKAPNQADRGAAVATKVVVPDVVGMASEDAVRVLERAGFLVDSEVSYDTLADPDTVSAQDPAAGTKAVRGSAVLISVTLGTGSARGAGDDQGWEHRVPDVIGMTKGRATWTLQSGGYGANVTGMYSSDRPRGLAFSQSPAAGSSAEEGTLVNVLVSLGPAPASDIQVPDVRGMNKDDAKATLHAAGLDSRPTWSAQYDKPAGLVFQQYPSAGEYVSADTIVYYLIAVPDGQ